MVDAERCGQTHERAPLLRAAVTGCAEERRHRRISVGHADIGVPTAPLRPRRAPADAIAAARVSHRYGLHCGGWTVGAIWLWHRSAGGGPQ